MLLLSLSGCGGIRPSPEVLISEEAGQLFSTISRINAEVTSIKGIGKLVLRSGPSPGSFRFAWAAMPPGRIRIELMDPAGRPAGTLARDGTWTYLRIHQDNRLFRRRSLDRQISKWLGVPVNTADLIALVSGRVPLREYDAVEVMEAIDRGPVLILLRNHTIVERIAMAPDRQSVTRIDMFDPMGTPTVRIDFAEWRQTDHGRLPQWLDITSSGGDSIRIQFLRFRENVPIDPAIFVLENKRRSNFGAIDPPGRPGPRIPVRGVPNRIPDRILIGL